MSKSEFEPDPTGSATGPKYAELFDIYLMSFSGDVRSVTADLQRAFLVDPETARRMVTNLPMVVKRAVDPDLASQYFDVLQQLGAQVVLLPSPKSAEPPDGEMSLPMPTAPPARGAPTMRPRVGAVTERAGPLDEFDAYERPLGAATSEPVAAEAAFDPLEMPLDDAVSQVPDAFDPFAMPAAGPASEEPAHHFEFGSAIAPLPRLDANVGELPRLAMHEAFDVDAGSGARPDSSPPAWGLFERSTSESHRVAGGVHQDVLDVGHGSIPAPAPPPSAAADDDSWLHQRPPPSAPAEAKRAESGLFMASNADDFVGGLRSTQNMPLPVIKPLRERPVSTLPPPPTSASLPPIPLPKPNAARAASIPPPVPRSVPVVSMPKSPTAVSMSRRPPSMLDGSTDPGILLLDLDKVPPLPSLGTASSLDVDPGDLASLPRIELAGLRSSSRRPPAPSYASAQGNASDDGELASLLPLKQPERPAAPPVAAVAAPSPASTTAHGTPAAKAAGIVGKPPPVPARAAAPAAPAGDASPRSRLAGLAARAPRLSDGARRVAYALGLCACAVVIVGFGVRLDDSVLYGNASLPSVLLHSFAFYAVGAAVLGLFRS